MKNTLIAAVVGLGLGGAAGYIPESRKSAELASELSSTKETLSAELSLERSRLRMAQLTSVLGRLLVEVENSNFATAKEWSTKFFDALREAEAAGVTEPQKEQLHLLLGRRDEITSDISTTNAECAAKLRQMYVELHKLL